MVHTPSSEIQALQPDATWHQHPNGGGWVSSTADVKETAYVGPDAVVYGNAKVFDYAEVYEHAQIYENAWIRGASRILGCAQVSGEAQIGGQAQVKGNARVAGHARIFGDEVVSSGAQWRPGQAVSIRRAKQRVVSILIQVYDLLEPPYGDKAGDPPVHLPLLEGTRNILGGLLDNLDNQPNLVEIVGNLPGAIHELEQGGHYHGFEHHMALLEAIPLAHKAKSAVLTLRGT